MIPDREEGKGVDAISKETGSEAKRVLADIFGYHEFRPGQERIIAHLMAGEHVLAVMPTGGGKSLCYQIPAIVREGVGVVVSPLIALMRDQVEGLRQAGVRAACLNSTLIWRRCARCSVAGPT